MARTHTFKGSASAGYGYFAYIEDGQLVIGEDWGREGGILYKGPFDCKDADKHLAMLRKNSPKLYESILRYYAKEEAAKEAWYVRYRFKDSRDPRGNGYSGWISNTGLLIIEQDDPRGGGVRFEGKYEDMPPALAKLLVELRAQDPVLYDDIEKYFTKHGVSDESDKRAFGYCSEGDPRQKAIGYYCNPDKKTRAYTVKLIMDNGKELDAVISGTSETDVIRKIMLPVPDTVMMYDLEGRTMAVRSDKIYTVAIID